MHSRWTPHPCETAKPDEWEALPVPRSSLTAPSPPLERGECTFTCGKLGLIYGFLPCLLFSFPRIRCLRIVHFPSLSLCHSTASPFFAAWLHFLCFGIFSQQCLLLSPDAFVYTTDSILSTVPSSLTSYSAKNTVSRTLKHVLRVQCRVSRKWNYLQKQKPENTPLARIEGTRACARIEPITHRKVRRLCPIRMFTHAVRSFVYTRALRTSHAYVIRFLVSRG